VALVFYRRIGFERKEGRAMVKAMGKAKGLQKRVRYLVRLSGAEEVTLTGTFTGWDPSGIPLHQGAQGVWYTTLDLPPGAHEYRLRVDGEWRDDPESGDRVPNPFGTENCVLKVD
jgi:1,4-alpha-glucan branching enzyme